MLLESLIRILNEKRLDMSRQEALKTLSVFGVSDFDINSETSHEDIDELKKSILNKNKNIYKFPEKLERLSDAIDTLHHTLTYEQSQQEAPSQTSKNKTTNKKVSLN